MRNLIKTWKETEFNILQKYHFFGELTKGIWRVDQRNLATWPKLFGELVKAILASWFFGELTSTHLIEISYKTLKGWSHKRVSMRSCENVKNGIQKVRNVIQICSILLLFSYSSGNSAYCFSSFLYFISPYFNLICLVLPVHDNNFISLIWFTGNSVYRFSSFRQGNPDAGYPRDLSTINPLLYKVNAALMGTDSQTYFFDGEQYIRFRRSSFEVSVGTLFFTSGEGIQTLDIRMLIHLKGDGQSHV